MARWDFRDKQWKRADLEIDRIMKTYNIAKIPCGFSVGPGWLPPLEKMIVKLKALGWDGKYLAQVKQKFCQLRVYLDFTTQAMEEAIRDAEIECNTMCEYCGKPHGLDVPRGGMALCPECQEKSDADNS